MLLRCFTFLIFVLAGNMLRAQEVNFAYSAIPAALLENADVVKRIDELRVTMQSQTKIIIYQRVATTILNENADKYAAFSKSYDKLHSISSIVGNLYDASGKKVRTMKKSDLKDFGGSASGNLADDNKVKSHNFYYKVYPYTIEYIFVQELSHSFYLPAWQPVSAEKLAVEKSSLELIHPENYEVRFKALNYPQPPQIRQEKGMRATRWELSNLKALLFEYAAPALRELTPSVHLAPSEFTLQGFKGNMATWKDLGLFMLQLNKGRDQLPDDVKQAVRQRIQNAPTTNEKIKALYKYLQENTRYISVQMGIGGWQTFDAHYVARNKYGDCKALSNFMVALLAEAGITSYYALIYAGEEERSLLTDFSSNQFNHAIVCAVDGKDTTWLECTSQTLYPGYLSGFTENREALLITASGGQLVRTPRYGVKENLQIRVADVAIDASGNFKASLRTEYKALQQDVVHSIIHQYSKGRIMEILNQGLDLATYKVQSYDYTETNATLPSIAEKLEIVSENYAQVSGKRLFIAPNIFTKNKLNLVADLNRNYDIHINNMEYCDMDSISIVIPEGYQIESRPQNVALKTKFGNYHTEVTINGNRIKYTRHLEMFSGKFKAAAYAELVAFHKKIYAEDRMRLVFVKKD